MPTGYTADLMSKGQDFRTFVLTCARAFGACIMQRDDPMNEPPKKQEGSSYSAKALAAAHAELARLRSMNSDQQFELGCQRKNEAITNAGEGLQRNKDENKRLDDMMAQVVAWTPPTSDHAGVKSFMIEQITISRNSTDYYERTLLEATKKSSRQFYEEAIAGAERDIEYHTKEVAKEQERTGERNQWIDQLYASLPPMDDDADAR